MTRIILAGCHGRMGRQVSACCAGRSDISVAAGIDPRNRSADDYPVFPAPRLCSAEADVLVDFSRPAALDLLLSFCINRQLPILLAATGYSDRQLGQIRLASRIIPIFRTANLSIGANVLLRLARQAANALGGEFDVVITERHHREKRDSPSGTALMLAQAIPQKTDIFAIRAGTTAGEHKVMFAGPNEVLELFHRADSREVYAMGAIRAAQFLAGINQPGLYGMEDLLR